MYLCSVKTAVKNFLSVLLGLAFYLGIAGTSLMVAADTQVPADILQFSEKTQVTLSVQVVEISPPERPVFELRHRENTPVPQHFVPKPGLLPEIQEVLVENSLKGYAQIADTLLVNYRECSPVFPFHAFW